MSARSGPGARTASAARIEQLQAEAGYLRDRTALLRAKLYRGGLGTSARLEDLERQLERVEQELRTTRAADRISAAPGTPGVG